MNKIKILIIIIIAVIGALIIYNYFENQPINKDSISQFSKEYTKVDSDNIYKIRSIDEIIELLSEGTGIVFFCTPESSWCQSYAYYLNKYLKANNITEINYLDIKEYRQLNTVKYQKIVDLLSDYLYADDLNNKKIYMPDLTFIKDGNIVAHNNQTSLVQSEENPDNYWNENTIKEFNNKLKEYISLLNAEVE